ncbi:hypothetical protein SAMN02746041_01205 [Desulfacinum hydrothermale DSM 13146]|uniref:Uncharacterized protein n=1 Tax=Desulfacinum hydrothermale DSM 13146 TaxID=1121390 RepID=A0A1W1XCC2_9BACT|nr:hypothetical protein [Desulfacinum hydrothermale]SMC21537.1 hypothetical protein SAMN02746041_01205 [Desulfacinum hydrothermale DSM 13146]
MSRTMQIDIRLLPAYGSGGLAKAFPRCAAMFRDVGKERVPEESPTLYHLVDELVRLMQDPAVPDRWKRPLGRHLDRLKQCRDEAREHLLGRRLNELDQSLYGLEDAFEDLERDLSW